MQIKEDSTFGYSSSYWTDDSLLNALSSPTDNVNAKYASFLNKPFNTIRMCSGSVDTNCVQYTFNDNIWNSAKELFNSGFQRATDQDQTRILQVYGPTPGDYQVYKLLMSVSKLFMVCC